jgi:hypothetical protein
MGGGDGIVKALGCAKKRYGFKSHFGHVMIMTSSSWFVVKSTNYQDWTQTKTKCDDDDDLSWVWWTIKN